MHTVFNGLKRFTCIRFPLFDANAHSNAGTWVGCPPVPCASPKTFTPRTTFPYFAFPRRKQQTFVQWCYATMAQSRLKWHKTTEISVPTTSCRLCCQTEWFAGEVLFPGRHTSPTADGWLAVLCGFVTLTHSRKQFSNAYSTRGLVISLKWRIQLPYFTLLLRLSFVTFSVSLLLLTQRDRVYLNLWVRSAVKWRRKSRRRWQLRRAWRDKKTKIKAEETGKDRPKT